MHKFENQAFSPSQDTFGAHPSRTPISQRSNLTFNPQHAPKYFVSPRLSPSPIRQTDKFKWSTDLRLFQLQDIPSMKELEEKNEGICQEIVFQKESSALLESTPEKTVQIKKKSKPLKKTQAKRTPKAIQKSSSKEIQLKLDSYLTKTSLKKGDC